MDLREDFKEPPISFSKMEISHVSRNWLQGSVVNKKKVCWGLQFFLGQYSYSRNVCAFEERKDKVLQDHFS